MLKTNMGSRVPKWVAHYWLVQCGITAGGLAPAKQAAMKWDQLLVTYHWQASCRLRIAGLQAGRSRDAASTQRRQLETVLRSGWQTLAVQETQPWRTYDPAGQSSNCR